MADGLSQKDLDQSVPHIEKKSTSRTGFRKESGESEALFRVLFESAPEAMVVIDVETGTFVDANTKAVKLFGIEHEKLIGSGPLDISPQFQPDGRASDELIQEKIQELLCENPKPFEWVHRHACGRDILCEIYHSKLPMSGLKLYCAIAIDITERRRAENEILQFKHIIESTRNPVGLVDRSYIYQYINEPYRQALNKPIHEIIGHSVPELFGHNLFETVMEPHYKRCLAGEIVDYQAWFEFPGWGRRYMDVRYYPFRGADGRIAGIVVNAHDVTKNRQLDIKLKESEDRFRAFMDNYPASIYIKDEDDRHIYGNPTAMKSVGKKPDEFFGSTTQDFFPPEVAAKLIALDRKTLKENIPRIIEEWRKKDNDDVRWIRDIKFPISLESGKKLLGGIAIDITEIKQSEQNLQKAFDDINRLREKLEQENIYLREELKVNYRYDEIIGESDAIKKMLHLAEQVAKEETAILLLGETGTGKELLARAIHKLSPRSKHSIVNVNCAALPANLIESELFGREKGAFTGAMTRQSGRFEAADGSTIFLDEIGDLPLELQSKLLRVLQEGQFERLGSNRTIYVDVRVIAATNRDLKKAVREGRFRKDLYYRLNVFPIKIPPLRERRLDIPLLAWAFVKEYNKSMGKQITTIKKQEMERLKAYSWPGNVRELKNVIERSMILCAESSLHIGKLEADAAEASIGLALSEVEKNHILKVLESTGWRVSGSMGAAEILELRPTTLESRMKKLGIRRPS